MTKFNKAIYKNKESNREIKTEDLLKEDDFETVVENIYCPGTDCEAKLVFHRKHGNGISGYLSRHPKFRHSESCEYEDYVGSGVKSEKEYIDIDTGLDDISIERRKREMLKALDESLNPRERSTSNKSKKVKKAENSSGNTEKVYRINYDSNKPGDDSESIVEGHKKIGPRFSTYFPQEMMLKDSNKNVKTCAKLTKVIIKQNSAIIEGILGETNIKFILPQSFFNGIVNGFSQEQIMNELLILKNFLENSNTDLYMVTMAQTKRINPDDLEVFVYDYRFLAFKAGKNIYITLANVVANIQAKVLR